MNTNCFVTIFVSYIDFLMKYEKEIPGRYYVIGLSYWESFWVLSWRSWISVHLCGALLLIHTLLRLKHGQSTTFLINDLRQCCAWYLRSGVTQCILCVLHFCCLVHWRALHMVLRLIFSSSLICTSASSLRNFSVTQAGPLRRSQFLCGAISMTLCSMVWN